MHRADAHARKQLARRVFRSGFRQFLLTRRLQHGMLLHAQKLHARRLLTATLAQWRSASVSETQHDHSLLRQLQAAKARRLTVRVMAEWSEYARAKMASRLVTAELRGRAQTRMLRLSVHGWLDAVAALRWKQVHQERADFHRRRVLLRQCLVRWRSEVQVRREYRRKVRTALIHWKLTRERRAFDIWSRYCASKRAKRQRIHDALAFRHASFVRDGLQRWISAAMHLQAQRDDRMQDHQAARTARVWRRVAVIARHWRYLAGRRRIGNISQQMRALPSDDEDVNWLTLKRHRPRLKATPIHSTVELEGVPRVEEAATLSGFVRLPRTRPQPRKPIELLLWEQQQQHRPKKIDPIDKWPTSLVHDEDLGRLSSDTMERAEPSAFNVGIPATEVPAAPVKRVGGKSDIYSNTDSIQRSKQSADSVLDILESRLRKLEARKREWVALERQLSTLRANVTIRYWTRSNVRCFVLASLDTCMVPSNGSEQHMLDQVRGLEREVDARRQQWQLAQKRVRHVATELAQLQAALHVQ